MATSDNKTADTDEKIFIGKGESRPGLRCACESAWPCHRSDCNRQDRIAAGDGGRTFRAWVCRCLPPYQGRPLRYLRVARARTSSSSARQIWGLIRSRTSSRRDFGDVFGEQGIRSRHGDRHGAVIAVVDARPDDVQEGVLNVVFRVADENGLTLIDMKDLRSLLDAIVPAGGKKGPDAEEDPLLNPQAAQSYGNVSKATVGPSSASSGAGKPGRHEILRRAGAR